MIDNLYSLSYRVSVPVYTKMKPKDGASQVINYKKEKLYDYYKCDYCGAEIRILEDKRNEMTGGIVKIPYTVTRRSELLLAVCNKCIKPMLKEFEEEQNNADR